MAKVTTKKSASTEIMDVINSFFKENHGRSDGYSTYINGFIEIDDMNSASFEEYKKDIRENEMKSIYNTTYEIEWSVPSMNEMTFKEYDTKKERLVIEILKILIKCNLRGVIFEERHEEDGGCSRIIIKVIKEIEEKMINFDSEKIIF